MDEMRKLPQSRPWTGDKYSGPEFERWCYENRLTPIQGAALLEMRRQVMQPLIDAFTKAEQTNA